MMEDLFCARGLKVKISKPIVYGTRVADKLSQQGAAKIKRVSINEAVNYIRHATPDPNGAELCAFLQTQGDQAIHFPTLVFNPPPDAIK